MLSNTLEVRFIFCRIEKGQLVHDHYLNAYGFNDAKSFSLKVNTTYEEIIDLLLKGHFLLPLDPPMRYKIVVFVCSPMRTGYHPIPNQRVSQGVELCEGQSFASISQALTSTISLNWLAIHGFDYIPYVVECEISIEVKAPPPPKKEANSTPPSLSETINAILTSPEVEIINLAASGVTITTALIIIAKSWSKTHQMRKASPSQPFPQSGKTEIYAIRVRMTDGRERTMQQWLTEPDELKRFIDVFNQPSSQLKPTEVVFVLWNRDTIVVDVTEGTPGNLQLDEMLRLLKIDESVHYFGQDDQSE